MSGKGLKNTELLMQLETSEHAQAYHLLQLFAYGTLAEYNSKSLLRQNV